MTPNPLLPLSVGTVPDDAPPAGHDVRAAILRRATTPPPVTPATPVPVATPAAEFDLDPAGEPTDRVEVELKFLVGRPSRRLAQVPESDDVKGWCDRLGGPRAAADTVQEVDRYYRPPAGRPRETLRVRQRFQYNGPFGSGGTGLLRAVGITHKGPTLAGGGKSRPEVELSLGLLSQAGAAADAFLRALGYAPDIEVSKVRRTWQRDYQGLPLTLCLDWLPRIGLYAEIESVAMRATADGVLAVVRHYAKGLGLVEPVREGYADLVRAAAAAGVVDLT